MSAAELYLCVHVPEFPAQARLRHRPEQRRLPVVILAGEPPLQQVCSATREALRMGITHGTTRAELDSFTGVIAIARSLPEERAARAALLQLAGAFTPRTQAITGDDKACTLVFDIAGTGRIFGPPHTLAQTIAQQVQELGLGARIAVSANVHTAVHAAPFAAAVATVIERGHEAAALANLPLQALGLSASQRSTFDLWGLQTVGELAALPLTGMVVRLGREGQRLRALARGEHPHLFVPEEDVFTLEEYVAFDTAVELLDSLLFVVGPMLQQLITRAAARTLALASVTIRLHLDGAAANDDAAEAAEPTIHVRTIKPALPLLDRDLLLKLLHLDLQAHPPGAAVVAIHLSAEPGDRSKVQLGLFTPQLPEPSRLDVTLARIAALVGEDRVGRPKLLDTHRPNGFVLERFTTPSSAATNSAECSSTLAMRRLRPPVSLRMRLHEDRPHDFMMDGRRYNVSEAYGPWRNSGEWWCSGAWSREEWDVRATAQDGDTLLCQVVLDRLHSQWQMEALYD